MPGRHVVLAALLLGGVGCDQDSDHARKLERSLGRAEKALDKAQDGIQSGYSKTRDKVKSVDWVQAFEDTKQKVGDAADKLRPSQRDSAGGDPEADHWWERGTEAVHCESDRCTVDGWFVSAARTNPIRLTGDVKVLTALDDSGWLLDEVKSDSAAFAMGFRKGDIVESVAGLPLTDGWARVKVLKALRERSEVDVIYRRGEERHTLQVVFTSE